MLSNRYRPTTWAQFIGQAAIREIIDACDDDWLFDGGGERWLFESDDIAQKLLEELCDALQALQCEF